MVEVQLVEHTKWVRKGASVVKKSLLLAALAGVIGTNPASAQGVNRCYDSARQWTYHHAWCLNLDAADWAAGRSGCRGVSGAGDHQVISFVSEAFRGGYSRASEAHRQRAAQEMRRRGGVHEPSTALELTNESVECYATREEADRARSSRHTEAFVIPLN